MGGSLNTLNAPPPDQLKLRRWFLMYGLYMAGLAAAILLLWRGQPASLKDAVAGDITLLLHGQFRMLQDIIIIQFGQYNNPSQQALKLLIYALYMSASMTFLPLNTGWIIAALAMRNVAISPSLWVTTLLVATIGAAASTVANVTDFHIFTLLLRHRGVAKLRNSRFSQKAERWFGRQPFQLLVFFNILPVPVDVARMLAAMHQYPLGRFVAANFLGRWIRYAIIAAITFELGKKGWISVVALLGIAVLMGLVKVVQYLMSKLKQRRPA